MSRNRKNSQQKTPAKNSKNRRRRKPKKQRHFWIGQDPMDPTDETIAVATDPAAVANALASWKRNATLAPVRDLESAGWKKFWADVDALLARAKELAK